MSSWPRPVRIDVRTIMNNVPAPSRNHLVTRPTGRRVRDAIERRLCGCAARQVSVIDLTGVVVLDYSCADEVIAKLLVRHMGGDRPSDAFFVFRVDAERHGDALQDVLKRQGLAAACDVGDGGYRLLGAVGPDVDRVWRALETRGRIPQGGLAAVAGGHGGSIMEELARRRLSLVGPDGAAVALSAVVSREHLEGGDAT